MIRDELLKMNKEFYWDCIVEHGYTICPDKIQKMYTNLINKEYNEENSFYFRRYVRTLENLIFREKIRLGIKTIDDYGLNETIIKNLKFISSHLPGDFCILEKNFLNINHYPNSISISADYNKLKDELFECKKSRIIIPLGIRINESRKKVVYHLNILIIDLKTRQVWRIEPNDVDSENIKRYSNALSSFFKPLDITYSGFYPSSCPIKHGGLCRYVVYAQYLYGKNLSYNNVKNVILQFLKYEILDLCKIK